MSTDSTIKFVTDRSVLGYGPGETIQLTEAEFERLGEAFFAQVEAKFVLDPTDGRARR